MVNSKIRRIDDLGRVVIPREIRRNLGIKENDLVEFSTTHEGTITIRKHKKSFEQCAIDWYDKATNIHNNTNPNFRYFRNTDFWHHGDYTFCVVGRTIPNFIPRAGHSKRSEKDTLDERVGHVAAYANAMGRNLNKMIGYEG